MSVPGLITRKLEVLETEILKTKHKQNTKPTDVRSFVKNRFDYYEDKLKSYAKSFNEDNTIPIVQISTLSSTVVSHERNSSKRVIIYGLLRRPVQPENVFLERQKNPDIEDLLAGNWIPTLKALDRKKTFDNPKYSYSEKDDVFLEDYTGETDTHSIKLIGANVYKSKAVMTCIPTVVIGRYNPKHSYFDVETFHTLKTELKLPRSIPKINNELLLFSGLNIGTPEASQLKRQLIMSIASGVLTPSHIVFLGGIFSPFAWSLKDEDVSDVSKNEISSLQLKSAVFNRRIFSGDGSAKRASIFSETRLETSIKEADEFFVELCDLCPTTVFPGADDLGYNGIPFSGFSRDFFPKASLYKNFRCCLGLADMEFGSEEKLTIMGLSSKIGIESQVDALDATCIALAHGQLLPGAPIPEKIDPWFQKAAGRDIFMAEELPEIILIRNDSCGCFLKNPCHNFKKLEIFRKCSIHTKRNCK